jgi:glutamate N-acetyltransferase/amino-acid N-acetyltransferase
MAVGLNAPGLLHPVDGVRLAAVAAGIRYPDRSDLALIELAPGTEVAAVFTRNAFRAAPVLLAEAQLARVAPRYLLINSGNANAGTGAEGMAAARASCAAVAARTGCAPDAVLPFSTGVIGEPLPVTRIEDAMDALVAGLSADAWLDCAEAIMTTDTLPKAVSREVDLPGGRVRLTGVAKGSGMIRPDMATMLAFVATDAEVPGPMLRAMLEQAVEWSFNAITVDGETSTNDACVFMATGASGVGVQDPAAREALELALIAVCEELAQAIVRDGEGASRFVTVVVEGSNDAAEARRVADAVAQSPLVKTALFAGDPNWGRILAAVGRAGVDALDIGRVDIDLGDVRVITGGEPDAGYTEARGAEVLSHPELRLGIRLGRGEARARVWTCDLSYDYVRINAEYRS